MTKQPCKLVFNFSTSLDLVSQFLDQTLAFFQIRAIFFVSFLLNLGYQIIKLVLRHRKMQVAIKHRGMVMGVCLLYDLKIGSSKLQFKIFEAFFQLFIDSQNSFSPFLPFNILLLNLAFRFCCGSLLFPEIFVLSPQIFIFRREVLYLHQSLAQLIF